ncbi:hypothetical protein ABPG72_004965 [Tetrahymena utriculariae]
MKTYLICAKRQTMLQTQNPQFLTSISLGLCENLSDLTLNLNNKKIGDEGISVMASALKKCPKIIFLSILTIWNQVTDIGISNLSNQLNDFTQLQQLSLNLRQKKQLLKAKTKLYIFNISYNNINDAGVIELSNSLKQCINIKKLVLKLCNNFFGNQGISSLGNAIKVCSNIKILQIQLKQNLITNQGMQFFGSFLRKCSQIIVLIINLKFNQQDFEASQDLNVKLKKMARLTTFKFDY